MKKWTGVALLLVAGGISLAADRRPSEILTVLASVHYDIGQPPARMVWCAEGLASGMFAGAGVDIIWHSHPRGVNRNLQPILIEIVPNAADRSYPGAFAYCEPFGGNHITIFWDRVKHPTNESITTALLAHVLVHEITHILQRSDGHSSQGIMKAHWMPLDILQMAWKPLLFDPADVRLIHAVPADRKRATEGIPEQISAR